MVLNRGYILDKNRQVNNWLVVRYLFGFSGDSLISGAIGNGAERDTAEEIEAYIEALLPPPP